MTGPDPTNKVTETVALDSCGVTAMVRESWFDGFGRTVSIVSDDGGGAITQATEYDGLGRVVRAHLPRRTAEADFWTESGYDGLGRVVTALSGCTGVIPCVVSGAVTTTQTSYSGLRTTVTDPAGKTRTTQMDGLGRLSQVEEPKSPTAAPVGTTIYTTTYGYNLQDLLTSVAQDTVTRGFSYDSAGRLLSATNPESGTTSYGYDNNGNLTSRTDGRGVVTTTSYDSLNRTTGRTYTGAATPAVTWTWDPAGNIGLLGSVASSASVTEYLAYDGMGRVTSSRQTTDGVGYLFGYTYNKAGGLETETYPSGRKLKTCYNGAGREVSVTGSTDNFVSSVAYAGAGVYGSDGGMTGLDVGAMTNKIKVTMEYNDHHRQLKALQAVVGGVLQWRVENRYCASGADGCAGNNGNIQQMLLNDGSVVRTQNFGYDEMNRLTVAVEAPAGTGLTGYQQNFGYTRNGNRWVAAGSTRPGGAYTANGESWYVAATNRYSTVDGWFGYDGGGNLVKEGIYGYTWDGENRMVQSTMDTGTAGTVTTGYVYDGDGRRVKRGGTVFVYDAFGKLAAEYGGAGPGNCRVCYMVSDHLGSVRVVFNESGAVVKRSDYMPFGEEILSGVDWGNGRGAVYNPEPVGVRQKFTGKERDAETGLDYFGARYFSGAQGRFTSPDPHNPLTESQSAQELSGYMSEPQNWNRYAYARNNPLKFFDPDGRETKLAVGKQTRDNPAGHVALIINGKVYSFGTNYSQGPNKDWGGAAGSYLGQQRDLRETDLLTLNVSDKQEKQLEQTLQSNDPNGASAPPYSLIGNSCVSQCERALVSTGILQNTPPGPVVVGRGGAEFQSGGTQPALTPGGLADRVQSQGLVTSTKTVGQQQVSKPESLWNALKRWLE